MIIRVNPVSKKTEASGTTAKEQCLDIATKVFDADPKWRGLIDGEYTFDIATPLGEVVIDVEEELFLRDMVISVSPCFDLWTLPTPFSAKIQGRTWKFSWDDSATLEAVYTPDPAERSRLEKDESDFHPVSRQTAIEVTARALQSLLGLG